MEAMKIILLFILVSLFKSSNCEYNDPLPKCACEQNYLPSTNSCVSADTIGSRPFYWKCQKLYLVYLRMEYVTKFKTFYFTPKFMRCQRWTYEKSEYEVNIKTDILRIKSNNRTYNPNEYYLEYLEHDAEKYPFKAVVCVNEESRQQFRPHNIPTYIYSAGWIVSIVSLIAAFILAVAVPRSLSHRIVTPCFIISLLSAYTILVTRALGPDPSSILCYSFGVGLQFTFLSAFFWLNVLAFDIWRKVSSPPSKTGCLRTIMYMLYGWGCPLVFVATAVGIDQNPNLLIPRAFLPNFGRDCWISETKSLLAFFYGPISVILLTNVIFFILTLVEVRKSVTGVCLRLKLFFELLIIMGLCWIMEVVSWAVGGDVRYWYFTDVINAFQGLFIFIVIARQRKAVEWLKKCFCCKKNVESENLSSDSDLYDEI